MALHNLHDFKIDKENPEQGIKNLIRIIKPLWDQENISLQLLSGGYSGKIFCCFDNNNTDDKITVRIRNLLDDFKEWEDVIEVKALMHMSVLAHFPTVHAVFENGYCYQYVIGKSPVNLKQKTGYIDDEILQAMAKELAFIHTVKLPNIEYTENKHFQKMRAMIQNSPAYDKFKNTPSKEVLLKENDLVEKFITGLNQPLTLCHGDIHPGNIVWDATKKKLTYIDWEGAHIGYRFYDISYCFWFIRMLAHPLITTTKVEIPNNVESKFLQHYFDAWCKLMGDKVDDNGFADFVATIRKFNLMIACVFIMFPIFFIETFEELIGKENVEAYFESLISDYLQLKKEFLGTDQFEN